MDKSLVHASGQVRLIVCPYVPCRVVYVQVAVIYILLVCLAALTWALRRAEQSKWLLKAAGILQVMQ
jgi:hypothetical protein